MSFRFPVSFPTPVQVTTQQSLPTRYDFRTYSRSYNYGVARDTLTVPAGKTWRILSLNVQLEVVTAGKLRSVDLQIYDGPVNKNCMMYSVCSGAPVYGTFSPAAYYSFLPGIAPHFSKRYNPDIYHEQLPLPDMDLRENTTITWGLVSDPLATDTVTSHMQYVEFDA